MRDIFEILLGWPGDGEGLREFAQARGLDVNVTYKHLALMIHPKFRRDSRAKVAYEGR
jgi:hypothetical protein